MKLLASTPVVGLAVGFGPVELFMLSVLAIVAAIIVLKKLLG